MSRADSPDFVRSLFGRCSGAIGQRRCDVLVEALSKRFETTQVFAKPAGH
jgi:hypothetical protein